MRNPISIKHFKNNKYIDTRYTNLVKLPKKGSCKICKMRQHYAHKCCHTSGHGMNKIFPKPFFNSIERLCLLSKVHKFYVNGIKFEKRAKNCHLPVLPIPVLPM